MSLGESGERGIGLRRGDSHGEARLVYHPGRAGSRISVVNPSNRLEGVASMSDNNERPVPDVGIPEASLLPLAADGGGSEAKPEAHQTEHGAASNTDPTVELKRGLQETRLP